MRLRAIRVLVFLIALSVLAAACGSSDDNAPGESAAGQDPDSAETATPEVSSTDDDQATDGQADDEADDAGSDAGDDEPTDPTAVPEPEPAASQGGTLVVAISSDPGQFNPAITTSGGVHTASELMYNGLLSYDEDFQPQPDLATSWEIENDGALYRFHLRDDVVWHDGTPFTSADVKYTFENVLTEFHSRTTASVGSVLQSVETPDATTVEFVFSEPYAPLLQQLDVTEAPIIAAHIYADSDPTENPANLAPIGTGPFMFSSYSPDEEIVLVKNPDYFKDGLPILDEVVMRVIPDDGSQVLALEAGEVDWLWGVPGPDLERLSNDDRFTTVRTLVNPGGANCIMTIGFNLERPILQDLQVRQAIAQGLDRDAFLERVAFGQGNAATSPFSSGIPTAYASGLDMPAFDVEAANASLDAAGWVRDGDSGTRTAQGVDGIDDGTELTIGVHLFPTFAQYGELMKALLAEIGVNVDVNALERSTMVEQVFVEKDFDTTIISFCNGTDPEIGIRRMYISTNIAPIPFSNAASYANPVVDDLFDQARGTVDPAERLDLYRQLQELLISDLPYFWLVESQSTRIYRADCTGFLPFGHFAEAATCGDS